MASIEEILIKLDSRLDRLEHMLGKFAALHAPEEISLEEQAREMAAAIKAGDKKKIKQLQQRQWSSSQKVSA